MSGTPEPCHRLALGENLLPLIRLQDLRHLHAALLLKAGVPVHVVAARLGHADPAISLRVYAHVLDDQASGAATTFEQLLNAAPTTRDTSTWSRHAEFRARVRPPH